MTVADRRQTFALAIVAPPLALLSWGCLFPFLAQVDVLRLSVSDRQLAGVYGTQVLLLSGLAALLLLILTVLGYGMQWVARRLFHLEIGSVICWSFCTLFFLISLAAAKSFLVALMASVGWDASAWPWFALIVGSSVMLATVDRPALAFFANIVGLSRLIALAGCVAIPFAFVSPLSPAPFGDKASFSRRPNVLLISLDALSARQMSLYGGPQPTTPNIDKFARKALVFDRAYAGANFTTAGVNTLLTGLYPSQQRSLQLFSPPIASARSLSIPAVLKRAGYYTGYVVSNPHAGPQRNGYGPYFDFGVGDAWHGRNGICEDRLIPLLPYNCHLVSPILYRVVMALTGFERGETEDDQSMIVGEARRFVTTRPQQPFFLWVHFFQPHDPFAAPAPWIGKFDPSPAARGVADSVQVYGFNATVQSPARTRLLEARYRESLAWVDEAAGRLIADVLTRTGPDLLVIVTADHGESFSDGWGGHGGRLLNDDVTHIPLIVRLPRQQEGQRIATVTSQTDVREIIEAVLHGADTDQVKRLVAARRDIEPAMSMSFIDNPHLGPLTRGTIAAIGPHWKYVRYLDAFKTPAGTLVEQMVRSSSGRGDLPMEQGTLRAAVDRHLRKWGGVVNETP